MIRGPGHLGYRGPTGGIPMDSGAESVGYIGDPTGGIPRDSGAESVGYIGDPTGGILRDPGAESVGYMGDGRWWRRRSGRHLNSNNPTLKGGGKQKMLCCVVDVLKFEIVYVIFSYLMCCYFVLEYFILYKVRYCTSKSCPINYGLGYIL